MPYGRTPSQNLISRFQPLKNLGSRSRGSLESVFAGPETHLSCIFVEASCVTGATEFVVCHRCHPHLDAIEPHPECKRTRFAQKWPRRENKRDVNA